jgi:tetratricopeptide (TPR) repeat protein
MRIDKLSEFSSPPVSPSALPAHNARWSWGTLWEKWTVLGLISVGLVSLLLTLQLELDRRSNLDAGRLENLRMLPQGNVLRPALLGFHHFGADLLWLRIVQVLGEQVLTAKEYEWLYHALDVVTTLDPQYAYVYDAGGTVLAELGNRVELSNQILAKGAKANPIAWRLPFVLGFNHFFHLHDYVKAGEYMAQAARIPGRPYYVDTLAARLYVEGGSPTLALSYLESMIEQTKDPVLREIYSDRYKEVLIVRDLHSLGQAIEQYRKAIGAIPQDLTDLVKRGFLLTIPDEPFGGEYQLNARTGEIRSSTHPEQLRLYRPGDTPRPQ